MKGKSKQEWLEKGYQMVSQNGFTNVNVESIARSLNKNKSSFYYYFGDWTGFEEALLQYHLQLAKEFAADASKCQSIIPDMIDLFVTHKADIFFHKQLRINRARPGFKRCFEQAYTLFEDAILNKWISFIHLEDNSFLATKILTLVSENFLLQITYNTYDYGWLKNYLIETSKLLQDMNTRTKK